MPNAFVKVSTLLPLEAFIVTVLEPEECDTDKLVLKSKVSIPVIAVPPLS